jgi:transposase-like protein
MKTSTLSPRSRSRRTDARQRAQLLAAFDRSGLSAAAFARHLGVNYTTFCGWRQQRKAKRSPVFVQVEVPAPVASIELVVELGPSARLRLTDPAQIPLAARLLQTLSASSSC